MGKFHSTVSRRDFMKGLGLAGAGLGAASASAPVFKDLDELASSPEGSRSLPWWISEREFFNPTVEVDWDGLQQFDGRNMFRETPEKSSWLVKNMEDKIKEGILNNVPGDTLKDHAWKAAFGPRYSVDYVGSTPTLGATGKTLFDLGIPKWQGTPEENTRMVTAALSFYGAPQVGVVEITDKTKKCWPICDSRGRPYSFEDVDEPYDDPTKARIIPNKCKYMVTYTIPQSGTGKYLLTALGTGHIGEGYQNVSFMKVRVQRFLRGLGYQGLTSSAGAYNVAIGILAGNGEMGRSDYLVTTTHGTLCRMSDYFVTDLPLAPTKPIDAGIWKFCQTCKKCAETCPSNSIPMDDEPCYDCDRTYNMSYGVKSYKADYATCQPWRSYPGGMIAGGCANCQANCVFSKADLASIHGVIKQVVSTTSIFNGFFKVMDDRFGYGGEWDPDKFWNRKLDNYNPDSYPFSGTKWA